MHGEGLDIASVRATARGETVNASWNEILETGVVWIGFPQRLAPGKVTLDIAYSTEFDVNLSGLFRVDEQGNAYALAKSESIQARSFVPSFDEPGFKATFDVALTIPEDMVAIANTPELSREPVREGYDRLVFARTRPLSTYLLSLAVGNFDRVERAAIPPNAIRSEPIPLVGYARAGKGAELDFILDLTPEMVRVFEEALQQPYPYEKLDIVAAPQWPSGATELAAAITYRESRILVNEQAGPAFLRSVKQIHAHEIAHMWFGNLVTPPWWDDLWLKESFAVWSEPMALISMEPDGGHEVTPVLDAIRAMQLDSLSSARAVSQPIDRNEDIRNAYDAITYNKGQAIIGMIDAYFGADVFRPALGRYIARFADSDADSEDFFEVIGKVTGEPAVTEMFRSFVQQNGVPVVAAELQCTADGAKLDLRQNRYTPLGGNADSGTLWHIPVCISWQEGERRGRSCSVLKRRAGTMPLEGAFCPPLIHPNAEGRGYYRFALKEPMWQALAAQFIQLSAGEALTTLDSAIAGFEAGTLPAETYRRVVGEAMLHPENTVSVRAISEYENILDRLEGTAAFPAAQAEGQAIADILRDEIEEGGADELEPYLDGFEALYLGNEVVLNRLSEAAIAFMDGEGELSSDVYFEALSAALRTGDEEMFEEILAARQQIDDPVFEQAVIAALGSARSEVNAARVRALVAGGEMGPRETYSLAFHQMRHPDTREAMWTQLQADFPGFLNLIPAQRRRATPRLANRFCAVDRIPEIELLFETHGGLAGGYEQALAETRETITLCAAQHDATQNDLETTFRD